MHHEQRRLARLALGLVRGSAVTDEELAKDLSDNALANEAMAYLIGTVVQMLATARHESVAAMVTFVRQSLDDDDDDGSAAVRETASPPGPPPLQKTEQP